MARKQSLKHLLVASVLLLAISGKSPLRYETFLLENAYLVHAEQRMLLN